MALGGGTFLSYNKKLPGSYINFVSAARASATVSDRGYAAMPLTLSWGPDGEIFTVEVEDFQKESSKIFGYDYTADELKGLRDLFKNIKTLYAYKLNNNGSKSSNTLAEANYKGVRGNAITIEIEANATDSTDAYYVECESTDEGALEVVADTATPTDSQVKIATTGLDVEAGDYVQLVAAVTAYDVNTYFDGALVDTQTVTAVGQLVANDYVTFKSTATLEATAGTPLTGGADGTATGADYQTFLDKIEAYSFNTLGCLSTEDTIKDLFVQFTKRLRDSMGIKFQCAVYNYAADYEGVINVKNKVTDDGELESSAIYWVTGASAGCAVNKSNTNKTYDGDFTIDTDYKQSALEKAVDAGEFVFHKVGDEVHVLNDINSFTSVTTDKNSDFQLNQVIRVLDQIGNDIATLFNAKYIGKVQNNAAGRISFWNDILTYNQELERIQALEDVSGDEIIVEKGTNKDEVIVTNPVTPVCAMQKLYMTVVVS